MILQCRNDSQNTTRAAQTKRHRRTTPPPVLKQLNPLFGAVRDLCADMCKEKSLNLSQLRGPSTQKVKPLARILKKIHGPPFIALGRDFAKQE